MLTPRRNLYVSNLDDKLLVVTACLRIALKYRGATRSDSPRTHTRSRIDARRVRVHDDILASFRAMGSHEDALACLIILLTGPQQFYISRESSNENFVVSRRFVRCFFRGRASHLGPYGFRFSLSFSRSRTVPLLGYLSPIPVSSFQVSPLEIVSFRYI